MTPTSTAMHTLLHRAQTFLAVVDFGSYTRAADFLGISKAMARAPAATPARPAPAMLAPDHQPCQGLRPLARTGRAGAVRRGADDRRERPALGD